MDVFVARQAILNRQKELHAYELLFRSGLTQNQFDGTDSSSATSQLIANTLFSAGLEGILGGKKGFINFDRKMLLDGPWSILPKEFVVVEVLETVEPDDLVIEACRRLRDCGYTIALDDFAYHPKLDPLIKTAHIIKVDLLLTTRAEQERLVKKYGRAGIKMLAEKVETLEEFEWAKSVGFDYFQGYFFTRPVIMRGRQTPSWKKSCLRLLKETQEPELDFDRLRDLIKNDVSFCYKLLRFTNSALFAHPTEIHTIEHALLALGEDGIRRWVALAALGGLAKDKPNELVVQSLLRAQFAERLARLAGYSDVHNWFLMGLFSRLDAMLDQSIGSALARIKVSHQIQEALLDTAPPDDRMASVYSLIRKYELGDWESVISLSECLGVPIGDVGVAYLDSALLVGELAGIARG
jgi:EAL and modified HD-GYP domain-containing signal transduction protein